MVEKINPFILLFASYGVGLIGTYLILFFKIFSWFENRNYIGDGLTQRLGVLKIGWLIRKSPLKLCNIKLYYSGALNPYKLRQLQTNMSFAELNHLRGFISYQLIIFLYAVYSFDVWHMLISTTLNIIFNLYLVFLQQYNKRRIDRLL